MSPRTAERPAYQRDRPIVGLLPWYALLGAVATVAGLVGVTRALAGPSFVEQLTVVNPTPYAVDVDVTGAGRHAWLQLGEARPRRTTVYQEVLDQGVTWIVRLADGEGGEFRLTRDELERAHWRLEIPTSLEARLRPSWGPPELLA